METISRVIVDALDQCGLDHATEYRILEALVEQMNARGLVIAATDLVLEMQEIREAA